MKTFDQALFELYEAGFISYEDAMRNADSKNELRLRVKLESKRAKGSPPRRRRRAQDRRGRRVMASETPRRDATSPPQERVLNDSGMVGGDTARSFVLNTKPLFKLMVEKKASDLFFTSQRADQDQDRGPDHAGQQAGADRRTRCARRPTA